MIATILLGAAICSRPIFFLILPLVFKLCGFRKGFLICLVAGGLLLLSLYLGWSGSHLRPNYADITAGIILAGSIISCLTVKRRDSLLLTHACLLTLPALYVSNAAYHVILAAPFFAWAWEAHSRSMP